MIGSERSTIRTHQLELGLTRFGYCWRSRQVGAGMAISRTKADWRVLARGVLASQEPRRQRFMAAAVRALST